MKADFDPDAPASGSGIYGLPHSPEEAEVVLIPVPWEATVSYRAGTARGPQAILEASAQVDLFDRETGRPYERGIAMLPISGKLWDEGREARAAARKALDAIEAGREPDADDIARVNELCQAMNEQVYRTAGEWMDRGKLVGVVGGDHSSPFGLIRAVAERHPGMGILQLDAHADLRNAYQGFAGSHASVMKNVLDRVEGVSRIVQVGVRDLGAGEDALIRQTPDRLRTFFDADLRARLQQGTPWAALVGEIVDALPQTVHLSFDVDGLDPALCPHTGTPVPGGLSFAEAVSLVRAVAESGRRVVGLDLDEVAPAPSGDDEWDGNVGARLLYKMIGFALASRG